MIVLKFGGSSIGSAEKVRRCIELVGKEIHRRPLVVVSAHGTTTNELIAAAERARAGSVEMEVLRSYHLALARELALDPELIEQIGRAHV